MVCGRPSRGCWGHEQSCNHCTALWWARLVCGPTVVRPSRGCPVQSTSGCRGLCRLLWWARLVCGGCASQSWLPRAVHDWLPSMQLPLLHVPKDQVDLYRFLPALCQLRFACGIPTLQPLPARCQTMIRSLVQLMFPAQRWTPLSFLRLPSLPPALCQPMPALSQPAPALGQPMPALCRPMPCCLIPLVIPDKRSTPLSFYLVGFGS